MGREKILERIEELSAAEQELEALQAKYDTLAAAVVVVCSARDACVDDPEANYRLLLTSIAELRDVLKEQAPAETSIKQTSD